MGIVIQYGDEMHEAFTYIKQYGMKRSGTNFTKEFIQANFPTTCVTANVLGWKHGYYAPNKDPLNGNWLGDHGKPTSDLINEKNADIINGIFSQYDTGNMLYVVTARNPYVWFASIARYVPFKPNEKAVLKYMGAWNAMHKHWIMALPAKKTCFITYEKLLDNPADAKKEIAQAYGIKGTDSLNLIQKNVAPGPHFNDYFRKRTNCFAVFNQRMLNLANSILDPDIMQGFGYTIVRKLPVCK